MSDKEVLAEEKKTDVQQFKKVILLAGGVGPAAGVSAHHQIVGLTDNGSCKDQGHASVIHLSFSGSVLDRTVWLFSDRKAPNPGGEMAKAVNRAMDGFMKQNCKVVLGVPCNTFHAPAIWDVFIKNLNFVNRIKIVHMIEETAQAIKKVKKNNGKVLKVGLMATDGTRKSKVYDNIFKKYGDLQLVFPEVFDQKNIMDAIYNSNYGVKGQTPDMQKDLKLINGVIDKLRQKGATAFILGCTELPLPFQAVNGKIPNDCFDPANILVRTLITQSGHTLKGLLNMKKDGEKDPITGNDFLNIPTSGKFFERIYRPSKL
ncbi:aspartate/glutamate racemase family protein [Sneathiella sp. HT1-7]|uniref:aspartate/glutamate racemase family protein n=1 Tax=Sneathiella sp. HT1-7 TaxID=2887192 RepID=UPI001D1446A4|nr:aspartate/glutamate racemase family protein [Sneathiella sp. HT1-7]MCC3306392.1 aspartate/glutamate racemase family protein [Sneathiella sp. HT1-7]